MRALFAAKNRDRCNTAAHEMSLISVARSIEKLEKSSMTNSMVERALEKIFVWLTGRTLSSATNDGGNCTLTTKGLRDGELSSGGNCHLIAVILPFSSFSMPLATDIKLISRAAALQRSRFFAANITGKLETLSESPVLLTSPHHLL